MDLIPIRNGMIPFEGSQKSDENRSALGTFSKYLRESIQKVNNLQKESDEALRKLTTGENADIHSTMIAMQKATISFEMLMQVRNKIVNAYDEIKRMQL